MLSIKPESAYKLRKSGLTHLNAKLGVGSRGELAAQFRDNDPDDGGAVPAGRNRTADLVT